MDDLAENGGGMSEQPPRRLHVALRERLPDPRRGDAAIRVERTHVVDDVDAEAVLLPETREHLGGSRPALPEAEVVSDEHRAGRERLDQHPPYELVRGQRRERLVESQQQRRIDPGLGEQTELLRDPRRRREDRSRDEGGSGDAGRT